MGLSLSARIGEAPALTTASFPVVYEILKLEYPVLWTGMKSFPAGGWGDLCYVQSVAIKSQVPKVGFI